LVSRRIQVAKHNRRTHLHHIYAMMTNLIDTIGISVLLFCQLRYIFRLCELISNCLAISPHCFDYYDKNVLR